MAAAVIHNQYLDGTYSMSCAQETYAAADRATIAIIRQCHEDAKNILRENRELLDKIAAYLLKKETITGQEMMAIIEGRDPELVDNYGATREDAPKLFRPSTPDVIEAPAKHIHMVSEPVQAPPLEELEEMTEETEQTEQSEQPVQEITVSEYISAELENDDLEFQNTIFKKIYTQYFQYRAEEKDNDKIVRMFANGADEQVTQTVLDLVYQEYTVTIKEFQKTLTPEENQIGKYVPKAILIYKAKVAEYTYNLIMKQLGQAQQSGDVELQNELMQQIQILMMVKNQFSKELNRLT